MRKTLKKIIKNFFRGFGLKISGLDRSELSEEKKIQWFKNLGFRTIIDVGASKGKASLQFHQIFPKAKIYAFEPLSDCFSQMREKLKHIPNNQFFNLALSDYQGQSQIFRSSYSGASSLIPMSSFQKEIFPITAGGSIQNVKVDTMDNVLARFNLDEPILVKIDVQGAEDKVIRGGQVTFDKVKAIIVETSFCPLYDGQPLFDDIYRQLEELGYKYVGIWGDGDFRSPIDGRPLQQDSVFIKV